MDYKKTYTLWKKALPLEQDALSALAKDTALLEDAFGANLSFGTAGMRGKMGLGTNRMNIYTVRRATQGYAEYIHSIDGANRGVVIAYDTRTNSAVFAKECALMLAKNNIKVYLYDGARSVPQLSFSILALNCAGGIVITASHNEAPYNGYKAYNQYGGQVLEDEAMRITSFIAHIANYLQLQPLTEEDALQQGLLTYVGAALDEAYFSSVTTLLHKVNGNLSCKPVEVVYTPLYGTGKAPILHLLNNLHVPVHLVEEQATPNGAFPGLSAPNPEDPASFALAIEVANAHQIDIILATDPDADRLGVALRNKNGMFQILSGNQLGCILLAYLLERYAAQNTLPQDGFITRSIVTTPLADQIAAAYHIATREVFTGFKYVANEIRLAQAQNNATFLFGFEDSYGYLASTDVRDKDAPAAAALFVSAAAYYAAQKLSLFDVLEKLYQTYGYYLEDTISLTLEGTEGQAKMQKTMDALRAEPLLSVDQYPVTKTIDYMIPVGTVDEMHSEMPPSDVLQFDLENGKITIRPSGTEPKLKVYLLCHHKEKEVAEKMLGGMHAAVSSLLEKHLN